MSDTPDNPDKIPFKRTDPEQHKVSFNRSADPTPEITNPDGSPLRDKDNAQTVLKPTYATRPARNLAPGGSLGIRTGLGARTAAEPEETRFLPQYEEGDLAHDHGIEVGSNLFTEGRILSMPGYSFEAKLYDEPSHYGIGEGKISKLDLRKDGALVARYDRGWDLEPKTAEQREAIHRIRTGLDDTPAKRIGTPDHTRDQSHDRDR